MRDDRWSILVGRVGGVALRLHMFFWLFAASTAYFVWQAQRSQTNQQDLAAVGLGCLLMLGLSMLLHEAAHCVAARRGGGEMSTLVVGPLIGLSRMSPPSSPRSEVLAHLAAPAVNLLVAISLGMVLLLLGHYEASLLNPLSPAGAIEGAPLVVALKLTFWINWVIGLLNLLPAFPFDGGRALRAGILWRSPQLGRRVASRRVTIVARLTASLLLVAAVFWWPQNATSALDGLALTLLAIFIFFSQEQDFPIPIADPAAPAQQTRSATMPAVRRATTEVAPTGREEPLYDTFTSEHVDYALASEEPTQGFEPEGSSRYEAEDAAAIDEQRVDEILIRVHQHGMSGLSDDDRDFLQRASARYRERRQLGVR